MTRRYYEVAVEDLTPELLDAAGVELDELVQSSHVKPRVMLPLRLDSSPGSSVIDRLPPQVPPRARAAIGAALQTREEARDKIKGVSARFWDAHNVEPPV